MPIVEDTISLLWTGEALYAPYRLLLISSTIGAVLLARVVILTRSAFGALLKGLKQRVSKRPIGEVVLAYFYESCTISVCYFNI
jgi:hypothetical protein